MTSLATGWLRPPQIPILNGAPWNNPWALERGCQWRLDPRRQFKQSRTRLGACRAATGKDQGTARRGKHTNGFLKRLARCGRKRDLGHRHNGVGARPQIGPLQIHAHVKDHRTPTMRRHVERPVQVTDRCLGAAHFDEFGTGGCHDLTLVDVLQMLQIARRGVTTQNHQRDATARGLGQGGTDVGQGRSMGDGRHARAPRRLCKTDGRQNRVRLMGAGDIAAHLTLDIGIHHEQVRIPDQTI